MSSVDTGDGNLRYEYLLVHIEGEQVTHIPANPLNVASLSQSLSDLVISLCNEGWQLSEFIDNKSMVVFRRPRTHRE